MINLDSQLCKEFDLTFWQLNTTKPQVQHTISAEEKELLRKVLVAKAITLNDDIMEVQENGVVIIQLPKVQLKFDDVTMSDTNDTINLAKIADMLKDNHYKKQTWYKLKDILV